MLKKQSRLKRRAKSLLYVSNLFCVSEGMLGPLFALFTEKIGGSVLEISIAWALYLIVSGVLIMLLGKISDKRVKKELLLVLGYFLNTIFTFGFLFVNSPASLFIIQIGLGTAAALITPTWDALYAKHTRRSKSGYAWGLAHGQAYILTGAAMLIGGAVVAYLSFNLLFVVMGMIQALGAVIVFSAFRRDLVVHTENKIVASGVKNQLAEYVQ